MKSTIARRWVKALRSGKYEQANGKLFANRDEVKNGDKPSMCCLGVLCDLHSKSTGRSWGQNKDGDATYFGENGYLPSEVAKWAGIKNPIEGDAARSRKKAFDLSLDGTKATNRNDIDGDTFEEIAAAIEADPASI
jgi:hypothetical protein